MAMRLGRLLLLTLLFVPPITAGAQSVYYPERGEWQRKTPAEAGISAALLKEAVDFAVANETKAPRDLVMNHYQTFGREPFGYAIGPIREAFGADAIAPDGRLDRAWMRARVFADPAEDGDEVVTVRR